MAPSRTMPPRIQWPDGIEAITEWDGLDGLERAEGLADRMRLTVPPPRWSEIGYARCTRCGTTDRPHRAKGMCASCYQTTWTQQRRAA